MDEKIILLLKDMEKTDVYGIMDVFHIGYDDAAALLHYLSLDGILVPTDKEDVFRVSNTALQSKSRIAYKDCLLLGMQIKDMNPYLYAEIIKNEGVTAKNEEEESLFRQMEALSLICRENGKYYSRLPMGCARLIADVATHYMDFVYRYCMVEPMLHSMIGAQDYPEGILRNPMILRRNRCLARILLEDHQRLGTDLSPKFCLDAADFEEELAKGFIESALCEFDAEGAMEYLERILPYCNMLMDCPHLPGGCKSSIKSALARLPFMSDREIAFEKRFYTHLHRFEAGISRDVFDDALF